MGRIQATNISELQLRVSPFNTPQGVTIRAVNVETDSVGAKRKRAGYSTYLGTADGSQVNTLFDWHNDTGTQFWNYRASGSSLYYSTQGTGAWTLCGNGTIVAGGSVAHAVSKNTLFIADAVGSTRHSTNGTSFTDTTGAPVAVDVAEYQQRMWALGTESSATYSIAGTPTDFSSTDSSVRIFPGAGRLLSAFKSADRLIMTKTSGIMFRYDGFSITDLATDLGPTSRQSIGEVEDFRIYINKLGFFGYGGDRPEVLSNPIQSQIYNDDNTGIQGTTFDNAPATIHKYNYYCTVGTVTDDLTRETVADAIMRYDFQLDQWDNWKFADRPTAWHSYKDVSGNLQLIFGDSGGQCYTQGGTVLNDNGSAIEAILEGFIHGGTFEDKKWNVIHAMFNPGSQAKLQVAIVNTFTKEKIKWIDLGQAVDGVIEYKFPPGTRGRFLLWKVYEASRDSRFQFYGFEIDADVIEKK